MKRGILAALAALVILFTAPLSVAAQPSEAERGLTILFTHDMHDHVIPSPAEAGGEYGGFARLMTLLERERNAAVYPVVTVDGGDFSMGTLYQTVYTTAAPELRLMGAMGYDVTTLGNHEFDFRAAGLAEMLRCAVASGDVLPQIVLSNYKPPAQDLTSRQAWDNYGICDYTILEREGLRIAVFGLMGENADECAPMSGMEFEPIVAAARRTVTHLKEQENPDFILCLSHTGTVDGKGEDYELARSVDGIDVIISGHTHTELAQPIRVKNTWIVSCGEYTKNLGVVTLGKSNGVVSLKDYRLVALDETVDGDPQLAVLAKQYQNTVEQEYLRQFGYAFDRVLASNSVEFTPFSRFGLQLEEDTLGNLITDSYVYAVRQAEGENAIPVDFAVTARGVVRDSFPQGPITVYDAFNVSSLGSGADGTPGYPLVSVYLTGKELKDVFEVDASVSAIMPEAQLYGSGMSWTANPYRMIFNRVVECGQMGQDGTVVALEEDRLYRVVTGLYCAQMLGTVKEKSVGLLSVVPKDAQGNPVSDFEACIVKNQSGGEVKEWYALASYLDALDEIPVKYAQPEGRKIVERTLNPVALLKNANWITWTVLAIALVLLVVLILIVRRVVRRTSRRQYGYRSSGGGSYRIYRGNRRK